MPTHVETLLTNIGISPEDVAKIVSLPEDDATFDYKPYVDKLRANNQTQLQNDPEFFTHMT